MGYASCINYAPEAFTVIYILWCVIGYALRKRREAEDIVTGNVDITL